MRKYIFFLSVILMGACQSPAVFEKYEEQPDEVWNRYHIVEFTADIPDSGQYIVKLCLRHTTDYEMANLWCLHSNTEERRQCKRVRFPPVSSACTIPSRLNGWGGSR